MAFIVPSIRTFSEKWYNHGTFAKTGHMKKILIIGDGSVGEHFIERAIETYSSENIYYIVQTRATKFKDASPSRFKFFEFDPTSYYKLANVLKMDFIQIFIVVNNRIDVKNILINVRTMKKQVRVVVLDQWGLDIDDRNVLLLDANEQLASRLIDYLPNVPVIAQNVGLAEGEIMEVLVPFGSSFVYRHVGVIEQHNWRIVGVYRERKLIMPSRHTMIQPNDLLLLIGQPAVLKSVYRAIKRELGQFPAPFGINLYLIIDMDIDSSANIIKLLRKAFLVHKRFKHTLIIKVLNPGSIDLLQTIKSFRKDTVIIDIDYFDIEREQLILRDLVQYQVGLVIVSRALFAQQSMREILFDGNVPVFKIAVRSFSKIKETVVVLSDSKDLENVSTTVFDISAQMGYNLEMFSYTNEQQESRAQIIEHYNNLSSIFSKSIKIIELDENPIRVLNQKDNFLHCLPFSEKILANPLATIFATDTERLYHRLDDYHQVFIPVKI